MSRTRTDCSAWNARQQVHHAQLRERIAGLGHGGWLDRGIRQVQVVVAQLHQLVRGLGQASAPRADLDAILAGAGGGPSRTAR